MTSSANPFPVGTAPVKAEYLLPISEQRVTEVDDDAAEGSTSNLKRQRDGDDVGDGGEDGRTSKKEKLTGAQRRKLAKEEKKKQRGSNKGRRWGKTRDEVDLCWKFASSNSCEFGAECRFTHDIPAYLAAKPRDIYFPSAIDLSDVAPFVRMPERSADAEGPESSVDFATRCPVFDEAGSCRLGLKCRFLGGHAQKAEDGTIILIEDDTKKATSLTSGTELNFLSAQTLKSLRTKKYSFPVTDAYLEELKNAADENQKKAETSNIEVETVDSMVVVQEPEEPESVAEPVAPEPAPTKSSVDEAAAQVDTPDVPPRFAEKKRLIWSNKTYLAPLTTVGNLPFRRLCLDYGADITCGEMGLASSFLSGSKEEWSLVRRHPSEKMFGVQLAGSKPASLVPTAEVIARECAGGVDFVDLNCGCPIDLVFRTGSGSALLDAAGKLGKILIGMNRALGDIPMTVKLRTGVKEGKNTSHKLMPRISAEWNVSAMTLHGRTRQQRYSKLADWDYVKQCVEAVRAREADEDLPRIPIFGGGDCFSSQDYWSAVENTGVDGVMVARGALIKPWIFTEIKEHREWDITSKERLELIRKYAEYGLDHFGTDTAGVNTTRRYLCEALSFQYRYVPLGLLEHIPARINDRAPLFRGRDDLETLLASGDSRDWVKISEMFLGPAPESWTFTPKHKSNAYGNEEGQG
ncbi:zinc finger dihydrouridine synthase [Artomyces pyxidatus]|uniref:Zinc finger dihydrouridine synthase n=1 Tax=Artomyces pyxidatus TaxID=48021 RepID=A0ACB8SZJ9_9AGAM|nr:zinc finger dihydrouridine synthase [Artomyces pyxidatus]